MIFDEICLLGDTVVKLLGRLIVILCQPIDRWSPSSISGRIDRLDQFAPDALTSHFRGGIEVLQVADIFDPPAVPVKEVVNKADELAVLIRDECAEILRRIAQ